MVYIQGEEMTRYCMELVMDKWVKPHVDISKWEFYDLSCASRDKTEDKVLKDAVEAGKRIGAIFKEPTVTPTEVQKIQMGLKKAWGSPNGAMRRGWNGITISRDTIHIKGLEHLLGFKKPVLFERHAVGGEYQAGWRNVGAGTVETIYTGKNGEKIVLDTRTLKDSQSAVVTYHNPLDNVIDLAHIFFGRCLEAKVTPYVVTKKTVFKWQEGFWSRMKEVFDKHYKIKFIEAGLLDKCGYELPHLISDSATMQIIRHVKFIYVGCLVSPFLFRTGTITKNIWLRIYRMAVDDAFKNVSLRNSLTQTHTSTRARDSFIEIPIKTDILPLQKCV